MCVNRRSRVCVHGEREDMCIWMGFIVCSQGERECVYTEEVECACMGRGRMCVYGRGGVCVHGEKVDVCI